MAQSATARSTGRVTAEQAREALRDRATVVRLLGLEEGRGSNDRKVVARCPFHDDRNPSFALVATTAGGWAGRCFGCDARGDALALVARHLGHTTTGPGFVQLLDDIGARLGLAPAARGSSTSSQTKRPAPPPKPEPPAPDLAARREIQHRIWETLVDMCPMRGEVLRYLISRGFRREEIPGAIDANGIPTAGDWCALPPPDEQANVVRGIVSDIGEDAWRDSGLADPGGRPRFMMPENRLVLPWWEGRSSANATVGMLQRRRIDANAAKGGKYVGPRGLAPAQPYGAEDIDEIDPLVIVIVEGVLDVHAVRALAREHGMAWAAVGIPGATAWKREWAALAKDRDLVVGLDDDDAGKNGTTVAEIWVDLEQAGARSISRELPMGAKDWLDVLARMRGVE